MSTHTANPAPGPDVDRLVAEFDEERPARQLHRVTDLAINIWCAGVAIFVLRQVFQPLQAGSQYYLVTFLGLTLPLIFVCYRFRARKPDPDGDQPGSDRVPRLDWVIAAIAFFVALYPVLPLPLSADGGGGYDSFLDRQGSLGAYDVVAGGILLLLVLEATRRTTGIVLPAFCLIFLAYGYYGGALPVEWAISHRGEDIDQIINALYNEASGFFGVPLDVAATYIVLFTIYGAVLDKMGAGRFFVQFSFSLFGKSKTAPGRTVATSGFLLGTVSGSGTATAVTLGSFAWPILKRAGYPREAAGGMIAASGIGAILSPPTLGAAAFIIAEYLGESYLKVLVWAIVPTLLYYLGIFLAVEIDARRFGAKHVELTVGSPWRLLARSGYHFLSLGVIVLFLALEIPPFRAVVYATAVAALFGLAEAVISRRAVQTGIDEAPDDLPQMPMAASLRDFGQRVFMALSTGIRSALPVVAVCAAAGAITSTIAKTGLGQVLSDLLVTAAKALAPTEGAVIVLTAIFAAIAILVLGLAVPVTASFILSWVIIGPALIGLGAEPPVVAMFIFYYAVLSEVSPPTALAAVASAAITGGRIIPTMMQACKYTLPAFLAPLAFIMTDNGKALVAQAPLVDVLWTTSVSAFAVAALAVATTGWMFGPAGRAERGLAVAAALLLLYLEPVSIIAGFVVLGIALTLHLTRRKTTPTLQSPLEGVRQV